MVSLGIGLTSDCNLSCAHCYRDQDRVYNLTLDDIKKVCESIGISSIGFGTGENGLNPEYFEILEYSIIIYPDTRCIMLVLIVYGI